MDFSFIEEDLNINMKPEKDINDSFLDEWTSNPEFFDSLFSLNNDFLDQLDNPNNDLAFQNMSVDDIQTDLMSSISTESDFKGFPIENDSKQIQEQQEQQSEQQIVENVSTTLADFIKNEQLSTSSSASDSGLSSDNLEMDTSPDYEPLSPTLSSPGPSISERGGDDSPPRCFTNNNNSKTNFGQHIIQVSSSPTINRPQQQPQQLKQQPNQQQSKQHSTSWKIQNIIVQNKSAAAAATAATAAPPPPKVIVEKVGTFDEDFENLLHKPHKIQKPHHHQPKQVEPQQKQQPQSQPQQIQYQLDSIKQPVLQKQIQNVNNVSQFPKEVKIYKLPQTFIDSKNKKVTIQLKDSQGVVKQPTTGTFVINRGSCNASGVRKLYRVANNNTTTTTTLIQNQNNLTGNVNQLNNTNGGARSILLPVSIQDVKDFRTIKIINTTNMKNKSANIKLAAANLLQQSKQGLLPKNVLVPKEKLIDDSMSDHTTSSTSDGDENYIFDDVMLQSNSIISNVESNHQQPVIIQQHQQFIDDESSDIIINEMQTVQQTKKYKSHHNMSSASSTTSSVCSSSAIYPKLLLNNEEKRLLAKEGIILPSNYPLTKHEERELKRIRRKIRNKISAQDSRKRKKEYVDGLEERVKQCTDDNQTLMKRIKLLQHQNHNLVTQMKKLQNLLTKGTANNTNNTSTNGSGNTKLPSSSVQSQNGSRTTQPATCLMVLLLSLALVALPNLKLGKNIRESELADALQQGLLQQNRRNLLFNTKDIMEHVDDEINQMDDVDIGAFSEIKEESIIDDDIIVDVDNDDDDISNIDVEHNYPRQSCRNSFLKMDKTIFEPPFKKQKTLIDFDVDDLIWKPPRHDQLHSQRLFNKKANEFQKNNSMEKHPTIHDGKTIKNEVDNISSDGTTSTSTPTGDAKDLIGADDEDDDDDYTNNNIYDDVFDKDMVNFMNEKRNEIYEMDLKKISTTFEKGTVDLNVLSDIFISADNVEHQNVRKAVNITRQRRQTGSGLVNEKNILIKGV